MMIVNGSYVIYTQDADRELWKQNTRHLKSRLLCSTKSPILRISNICPGKIAVLRYDGYMLEINLEDGSIQGEPKLLYAKDYQVLLNGIIVTLRNDGELELKSGNGTILKTVSCVKRISIRMGVEIILHMNSGRILSMNTQISLEDLHLLEEKFSDICVGVTSTQVITQNDDRTLSTDDFDLAFQSRILTTYQANDHTMFVHTFDKKIHVIDLTDMCVEYTISVNVICTEIILSNTCLLWGRVSDLEVVQLCILP